MKPVELSENEKMRARRGKKQSRLSGCVGAAAVFLAANLRPRRSLMAPEMKKGFTCLEKRGLVVRCSPGIAAGYGGGVVYKANPSSTFWDDMERWGMMEDGHLTAASRAQADKALLWQSRTYPGSVSQEILDVIERRDWL